MLTQEPLMEQLDRDDIQFLMDVLFSLEQRYRDQDLSEPIQHFMKVAELGMPDDDFTGLKSLVEQKQRELKHKGVQAFRVRAKLDNLLRDMEIAELTKQKI